MVSSMNVFYKVVSGLFICLSAECVLAEIHIENPKWSLHDDFEGVEDKTFWSSAHKSFYGSACTSDPKSSGKVLMFKYEKDNPEPGQGWAEKRFKLPIGARQIEMSYRLFVPKNFVHTPKNQKNFVFWSGKYGTAASNVWASSESWPASGGAVPSTYIGQDGANYGHSMVPNGPKMYVDYQGSWQNMHIYLELAEREGDYGVFEVHRNGVLVTGTTHPDIRPSGSGSVDKQLQFSDRGNFIDRGYLLGWAGGGFQETTIFCIDNFSIKINSEINNVSISSPPKKPPLVGIVRE